MRKSKSEPTEKNVQIRKKKINESMRHSVEYTFDV